MDIKIIILYFVLSNHNDMKNLINTLKENAYYISAGLVFATIAVTVVLALVFGDTSRLGAY